MSNSAPLQVTWIGRPNSLRFVSITAFTAFGAYFCMYAFRKPFAAAEFNGLMLGSVDFKIALILSQVAGYTISKFIGIRVIAEMPARLRCVSIASLIAAAESALVGFAVSPTPVKAVFLFMNGLSLGMVYGLVFAFLEGRRSSEVLAAALILSFVVATGVVKGVGLYTMTQWGVTQFWMPAVTGALFLLPLAMFTWMLSAVPPPSKSDADDRTQRVPMPLAARRTMLWELSWGLGLLVTAHMMLTALRDYRDKFTSEILGALDLNTASNVTTSELPIAAAVLALLAATTLIRRHAAAVVALHAAMMGGFLLAGGSTLAFRAGLLDGYVWFVLVGMGLYLAYVPFHGILFERVVALTRRPGNAGYLIYLADATGYLSSVVILLFKEFGARRAAPIQFFMLSTLATAAIGCLIVAAALFFFLRRQARGASVLPSSLIEARRGGEDSLA